jgi:hypothetical protein
MNAKRNRVPLPAGIATALLAASLAVAATGCSNRALVGGAVGATAVGGAYEYQNKRELDRLEDDYRSGHISADEYQRRRNDIEGRSLVY